MRFLLFSDYKKLLSDELKEIENYCNAHNIRFTKNLSETEISYQMQFVPNEHAQFIFEKVENLRQKQPNNHAKSGFETFPFHLSNIDFTFGRLF